MTSHESVEELRDEIDLDMSASQDIPLNLQDTSEEEDTRPNIPCTPENIILSLPSAHKNILPNSKSASKDIRTNLDSNATKSGKRSLVVTVGKGMENRAPKTPKIDTMSTRLTISKNAKQVAEKRPVVLSGIKNSNNVSKPPQRTSRQSSKSHDKNTVNDESQIPDRSSGISPGTTAIDYEPKIPQQSFQQQIFTEPSNKSSDNKASEAASTAIRNNVLKVPQGSMHQSFVKSQDQTAVSNVSKPPQRTSSPQGSKSDKNTVSNVSKPLQQTSQQRFKLNDKNSANNASDAADMAIRRNEIQEHEQVSFNIGDVGSSRSSYAESDLGDSASNSDLYSPDRQHSGHATHKRKEQVIAFQAIKFKGSQNLKFQYQKCESIRTKVKLESIKDEDLYEYLFDDLKSVKCYNELDDMFSSLSMFKDTSSPVHSILEFQRFRNALQNAYSSQIGDYLNKCLLKSGLSKHNFLNNLVCDINQQALQRYSAILETCNCGTCRQGLLASTDKKLNNDHCVFMNTKIKHLCNTFGNLSYRSLDRFMAVSRQSAYLQNLKLSDIGHTDFLELMSSQFVRDAINSLTVHQRKLRLPNLIFNDRFADWERLDISKEEIDWVNANEFNARNHNFKVYGVDSPDICSNVIWKEFGYVVTPVTDIYKSGRVKNCSFPGINAWKHVNYLTSVSDSICILYNPTPTKGKYLLAKVFFVIEGKEVECGLSLLEKGLAFCYPSASLVGKYYEQYCSAKKQMCGIFCYPKNVLVELVPSTFCKNHHHVNVKCPGQIIQDGEKNVFQLRCLPLQCEELYQPCQELNQPFCCVSNHLKISKFFCVKPSSIPNAGLGVFNSSGRTIPKGSYCCFYSEFSSDIFLRRNDDYVIENHLASFDGSYVREYHKGPMINDLSVTKLLDQLNLLVQNIDLEMARYLLDGEGARKIEVDSSNVEFYFDKSANSCIIKACKDIEAGAELFVTYGLKTYWYKKFIDFLNGGEAVESFAVLKLLVSRFPIIRTFINHV